MSQIVRLSDVAREAGVSLATASRALNGSQRIVAPEYRDRVLEVAERLGYRVNMHAQATARGSSDLIGLVVSDIADPYFSMITAGIQAQADTSAVMVTLGLSDRDFRRELAVIRAFEAQRPRSIIIAGSRRIDESETGELEQELLSFQALGGGVVLIGNSDLPFDVVEPENERGASALAETLVGLGYRRFAVLSGPADLRTVRDRVTGFTSRAAELGCPLRDDLVVSRPLSRDGGYAAMQALLERGNAAVDVVFAVTDAMAVGAMSAMRDAGLTPGVELAVAGFDDIPTARDVSPQLTTVRVSLVELGQVAMAYAVTPAEEPRRTFLPTEVVVRGSTPPRPSAG